MSGRSDWTMDAWNNSMCCHLQFGIIRLKPEHKSIMFWHLIRPKVPLQEQQILKMGSTEMNPQRTTPPRENRVERAYRAPRSPTDASASYRGVLRSRTPSSARSSRSSGPRRRCPRPGCFLWGEDSECASETNTSGVVKKKTHVTHVVFHYCYIEGERWRPRTCGTATIH